MEERLHALNWVDQPLKPHLNLRWFDVLAVDEGGQSAKEGLQLKTRVNAFCQFPGFMTLALANGRLWANVQSLPLWSLHQFFRLLCCRSRCFAALAEPYTHV